MCQVLKSFLSEVFVLYASTHPPTYMYIHHDKVIGVPTPPYYVSARIIIIIISVCGRPPQYAPPPQVDL